MNDNLALDELLTKVRQRADTYAYFFEKIDNARWIPLLREKGFFTDPIGVEHLEGGYVRFPIWPESRALARVAAQEEDTVMDILLDCPDTDNPRVHDDFLEAALQVSPEKAALLIPRIVEWLGKPYKLLMPVKAGKLLVRLSEAGLVDEALELAKHLFSLVREDVPTRDDEEIATWPRFRARFDQWEYKTVLEENVPSFVRAVGLPALSTLSASLQGSLQAEAERFGGQPHDASYIWRRSVADDEQNADYEAKDFLVTAIRDAAHLLISGERATVSDVVGLLEAHRWEIFDRIAIQVATVHADRDPAPAVRLLLRRDLLDSFEVSNEYSSLIRAALPLANSSERTTWLSWIKEGPETERYVERARSRGVPEPSPEELAERADTWRWQRLAFAPEESLDEDAQHLRSDLAERFDQPSPMPLAVYTTWGNVSPLSEDEAAEMSMEALAEYASSVPTTERRLDSPEEGLASVLGTRARSRPGEASQALHHFRTLKPLYMRSLIGGLDEAVRAGSPDISWKDVLDTAEWVLNQPREVEGGSGGSYSDLDPGWVWTINAIAGLLEDGLTKRLLGVELRDQTWRVLTALVDEPEQVAIDGTDPGTASINHTRGKALHAIIWYADWLFEINRTEEPPPRSFAHNSPEVADVLDARLDPRIEDSPAVRAGFGMRAGHLMKLDPEWLATRASQIFSVDERGRFDSLGLAAWSSYLKYSRRFFDLATLLRPQYEIAVAGIPDETGDVSHDLQMLLAEHLMVMYWHGQLGSAPDEDSLLADFWRNAGTEIRKRALAYVGHSLRDVKGSVAEDVQDRLMRLWDDYVRIAKEHLRSDMSELQAFGWWITSEVFEFSWVLPRAVEALELARGIDSPGEVIATLAKAPQTHLRSAAKMLRLLTANDREGWAIFGHQLDAQALLRAALQTDDPETTEEARTTANLLIARGYSEFRPLLNEPRLS